ncbi:hypothetical protein ABT247_17490 [Kitasatospora sp. NPDC001539]|uniref:hypothetical protein n=1 Tax=unclassified Kitasatospora TaxID=2633591 RepID=UPI00331ECA3D
MSQPHQPQERPEASRGELARLESYEHRTVPAGAPSGGHAPDGLGGSGDAPYLRGL